MGCGKQELADTNESTPTTNTNEVNGTTAKPIKADDNNATKLTAEEQKIVGEYVFFLHTYWVIFAK